MLKILLRDSPHLLPNYSEGSVFVDEFSVPLIGSVDLAGIAPSGAITLVECKLSKSSEIRRQVIGQVFAYASGLWKLPYADFEMSFSARSKYDSLGSAVSMVVPPSMKADWNEETFRLNVAENLARGRFTLVIAVDEITDELKRIVPYINSHTVNEVSFYAIEIGYCKRRRR